MVDDNQNNSDKEKIKTSEILDKSNKNLDEKNNETNITEEKDEVIQTTDNKSNDNISESNESDNQTDKEATVKNTNSKSDEQKEDLNEIDKEEQTKISDSKNETEGAKDKEEQKDSENNNNNQLDEKDIKWYVIQAHSGFEDKAVETIKTNAKKKGMDNCFTDFKIPKHTVIQVRKGKKINIEKKFFPGYLLVKMKMNNDTWQLVKKSNKVSGFVGNDHHPVPLSENEALKMLKKADDTVEYIAPQISYEVGEQVKISDGPFASFNGMVEDVDEEKGKLKISVSIFGRSTPVELDYTQVEKI